MVRIVLRVLCLTWGIWACAEAAPLIVAGQPPGGGDSFERVPFSALTGSRWQQVFSAADFAALSGPTALTSMFLDAVLTTDGYPFTVNSLRVSMSTTGAAWDTLSDTFSANLGPDELVVLDRPGGFTLQDRGAPFGVEIAFDRPFFYDPGAGNLLVDVVAGETSGFMDGNAFRANSEGSGSTARVYDPENPLAAVGEVDTRRTLVAQFAFAGGAPELSASRATLPLFFAVTLCLLAGARNCRTNSTIG